jgi:hypothetical protein
MAKIETTGIVFRGECSIRTGQCTALNGGAITAVWEMPSRRQINVCSSCLTEMVREGKWETPVAGFRSRADIIIKNKDGNVVFVAEIKNNHELDEEVSAEKTYSELLRMHSIPKSDYFLLVAPEKSYLWVNKDKQRVALSPSYIFSTKELFSPQTKFKNFYALRASEQLKKKVLLEYLSNIKLAFSMAAPLEPENDWLVGSGLFEEIKNGVIQEDYINKQL